MYKNIQTRRMQARQIFLEEAAAGGGSADRHADRDVFVRHRDGGGTFVQFAAALAAATVALCSHGKASHF